MDSQTLLHNLAGSIQAAISPSQISACICEVSAFLRRHPSDQSRPFFSLIFPSLLQRIFGFESISWLELANSDPDVAFRLFSFLDPQGPLFSSIFSVDQQSLVKYVFPLERLPEWIRFVLQNQVSNEVLSSASIFWASRIKEDEIQNLNQIQLNVFEYYIFWFSYYPVSRGAASDLSDPSSTTSRSSRKTKLENWVSSLPVISTTGRKPGQIPESSLYLRLLYSYLKAFVPKFGLKPYYSAMLNYSSNDDGSAYLQAEFVANTFNQFWLVDNDFSPLPVPAYQSFGLNLRDWIGKNPPTPGLGDVVKLLVNYLNFNPEKTNARRAFDNMIQRPLYRFILRSFLFCPIGASIKNASQVFSLWISYIEPWKLSEEDFNPYELIKGKEIEGKRRVKEYEPIWMDYVLSNYLFYSSMIVHFLEFAHKFIHSDVTSVIQMVSKLLEVICGSTDLLNLLRHVDTTYRIRKMGSPSSHSLDELYKYVPSIHEKLKDWEDGLSESETDVPYMHDRKDLDLKLFGNSEDGAHNLLELLVIRAEIEIRTLSYDVSKHLQTLDSIKSRIKQLFGDQIAKTPTKSPPIEKEKSIDQIDIFKPRRLKQGNNYRGDWMRRPISTDEVAWLARVLIRFSDWLNSYLALDRADMAGPTYVEVKGDEVRQIIGFKEAIRLLGMLVFSWFVVIGNLGLGFMRRRGTRINLRIFASKRFLAMVLLYVLCLVICRVISKVSVFLGFA